MPVEHDVVRELQAYGSWLAAEHDLVRGDGSPSRAAHDGGPATHTVETVLDPVEPTRIEARRVSRLVLLAAAVVVAVVAAVVVAGAARRAEAPAERPSAPPARLYVLPTDGAVLQLPSIHDGRMQPATGLVVGTPSGDGFVDPVTITVADGPPDRAGGIWREVVLASGAAIVDDPATGWARVAQQRDDRWLTAVVPAGAAARAQAALDEVSLDREGVPVLAPGATLHAITSFAGDQTGTARTTYAEAAGGIVVETFPAADPLAVPALGDRLEPVTIEGVTGWHASREGPDGTWNAVVWSPLPGAFVAVSGTADLDAVLDVARSLAPVDEATWLAAVGPLND